MRLKRYVLIVLTLLFCVVSPSQSIPLRFQGSVSDDRSDLSGVSIQISKGGKVVNNVITDGAGNYHFELPLGGDFLITVSKEGYVSKKFTVSTMGVPPEKAITKFPIIEASLTLFKRLEGIDYSLLNQPLNKYYYNVDKDNFEFDKNHLEQMLKGMETIKVQEKEIKNKEKELENDYATALKAGDKAYNKKDWPTAITQYQEAAKIKPKEIYPATQLASINKLMNDDLLKTKAAEEAAKKAKEKEIADAMAKAEADRIAKANAAATAELLAIEKKKAADKLAAEEKAKADALAKKQAEEAAAKKAAEDAALKARAEADALAKKQAETLAAKKTADEAAAKKAADDALAKKLAEEEAAAKALAEKNAKAKAEADALAKKQASEAAAKKLADESAAKAKEQADLAAKAEALLLAKKQADEAAAKKAAEDAAKAKADEAAAKKLADEAAAKKAKEQAEIAAKAEALLLAKKIEQETSAKKLAEENAAKAKAEKEVADKQEKEKAAKAKAEADALAKKQADEAAAAKLKAEKAMLPVLGASDLKYKEALKKADDAFSLRRYYDAKGFYEEALMLKSGDVYAKTRLMECERIINSDANQKVDERQKQLLAKYKPGVTEEMLPGDGVVVIKRVLVKDQVAYVYEKKVFNWGGIACFRDGNPITELTFENETKK